MDQLLDFINLFSHLEWFVLFIPFGILIFCGLGLPIPEDILLISMGFLVFEGYGHLTFAMILGYVGIMMGDSIIFFMGSRFGYKLLKIRFFSRVFTEKRLKMAENFITEHGRKTIFIARFLPGLRSALFFSAATLKLKFKVFFLIDSVAALISAPVFIFLGYYFGDKIDYLIVMLKKFDRIFIIVLVAIIIVFFVVKKFLSSKVSNIVNKKISS